MGFEGQFGYYHDSQRRYLLGQAAVDIRAIFNAPDRAEADALLVRSTHCW